MKNKIFSKTIAVFLSLVFFFGLIPAKASAQPDSSLYGEIKGFNRAVFDSRFSRADRETNPERWLFEAKLGITQAMNSWELIAGSLYENPLLFNEAKNNLEKWSEEELEARFSQWLFGRFFGEAAEKSLMSLSVMFGETHKDYSWHLDEAGNILFDNITGDPLVIRPDDNNQLSTDLAMWQGEAENHLKTNNLSFDNIITGLYTELLSYIPVESRESMNAVIAETCSNISGKIKTEFESIAAREERIFTNRRTRDILSLRKKSDDEAAKIFTEKLIAETEKICIRGIDDLSARIEEASTGTGDLVLLGEEWLRLYKEQFDRGLKAWEEAEERFFIRRIEWEQDALTLFSEGEKMWIDAFSQFEKERQKWELKAKELFRSGEEMFKNISQEFEKNIAEAKKEFELNISMRIGEGTTKIRALVDMYLICAFASVSAMENLQFWHNQYKSADKKDIKDSDFNEWLLQEQAGSNDSSLAEIRKTYDLYVSYTEKAIDARERIISDYAALFGTGALKDILLPDASSEDFCLDEYQLALIKAKALVLYWERKTAIAEAVKNYAGEFSAGRITEAEGIRAWENAKTAYNQSLAIYENELNKLNIIGVDIQEQQNILRDLSRELLQAEETLNRLNSEYNVIVTASIVYRGNFYLSELNAIYDFLADEYRNFLQSGDEAVYKTILEYGAKWNAAESKETAEFILNILINGDDNQIPSLIKLKKNIIDGIDSEINLRIRLAAIDLFSDSQNSQLRPLDSEYTGADWYSKAKGLSLTEEEKEALYGNKLREVLINDYKNSSIVLLKKRLELELNSLNYFLTGNFQYGSHEYIPPEYCLINRESSSFVIEVLLKLKKQIDLNQTYYNGSDDENEIINYFISGGTFFTNSFQYLTDYENEYNLCKGLLDIFNGYAFISSFAQAEFWKDTCNSLMSLYDSYNIKQSGFFLPDVKNIFSSILNKPGDFLSNSAQFLLEFDNCFQMIPEWLEYEINNWKYSLIGYIAANAFYLNIQPENVSEAISLKRMEIETRYNETTDYVDSLKYVSDYEAEKINNVFSIINNDTILLFYKEQIYQTLEELNRNAAAIENEKHWRQYLLDDYLTNIDSLLLPTSSWKESVLADAYFNISYFTNRLNDSFLFFSGKDADVSDGNAEQFFDIYLNEVSDAGHRFNSMSVIYNEIARLGKIFELSSISREDADILLNEAYEAVNAQEEIFNKLRDKYFIEAERFLNIGSLYDKQYNILKKANDNMDQKRFEYEKQDAIQRWASTAYLNTNHIDPEDSETKLFRAQTVLDVLYSIYSGENRRSYDNPEYNTLYSEYEQSFKRKLKTMETLETIKTELEQEKVNNKNLFQEYQNVLHQLGYTDQDYRNYISSDSRYDWTLKDIITVNDGRLVFSRDYSMMLSGIDELKAEELNDFFTATIRPDNERFDITSFDESLRELSQRMTGYFMNANKFRQWSLARDYLITSLINANNDLSFLSNCYSGLGQMKNGGALASLLVKEGPFNKKQNLYSAINVNSMKAKGDIDSYIAWFGLSEEERADLEYYVILTLSGIGKNYFTGFSQMLTLDVYKSAYDYTNHYYRKAKEMTDDWWDFLWAWIFIETRDTNYVALSRIQPAYNEINKNVQNWAAGLSRNLLSIQDLASAYIESCNKIEILEAIKTDGQNIEWEDINKAVLITDKFSKTEINELKSYWENMQSETGIKFNNMADALAGLSHWAKEKEDKNKAALENCWLNDAQNQQINEFNFQIALEAYIDGNGSIDALKTAAENTYGKNAAAWKNHNNNIHTVLADNLSLYLNAKFNFFSEFQTVGEEITAATVQMLENRYNAELSAREIEWDLTLKDMAEKYNNWLASAALIFENGRTDWNTSIQKMEEAYKNWKTNFQNEYNRVSDEWNEAYLAGLLDKEKWLEQAAAAVNQASAESFLALTGKEGERLSRFIDTREPFGVRNALPQIDNLISELLRSSGIANMYNAFDSINNTANTVPLLVRRGAGGVAVWDSSIIKTAAADMARETNSKIAEMESRKLAHNARLAADEALKNLIKSIDTANDNFRSDMDNTFILNGLWRRNGTSYVKDIVKGSTLFTPVIFNTVTVTGYQNYKTESITLQTNMDENYLAGLDITAVRRLVENAYTEIQTIAAEIFGFGETSTKINTKYSEDRTQFPGKFGAHIGYSPAVKSPNGMDTKRSSIFYDEGAGELGRLMSEYIYWSVIDGKGLAELALPFWDKRIWNDENSSFKSPTLRSAGNFIGSIAAIAVTSVLSAGASLPAAIGIMALGVGINTTDEFIFGALDVAGGYKTFDEAGFEFGKAVLTSTVSSAVGGVFNGIGNAGSFLGSGLTKTAVNTVSNPFAKVLVQSAMTGLQTAATGIATSAIGAITYDSKNGLSWSGESFKVGAKQSGISALSSMTSSFVTETLQMNNSGVNLEKLTGFNSGNKSDLSRLNNLLGSVAGQGINYAMGNDFTLNILNLSMLPNTTLNSGLLELHLGGNGVSMNIGANGANVSPDNLAAALRGAQVWNVNSNINNYIKNGNNGFDSAVSLRALYGYGDTVQTGELWNIIKGSTMIAANNEGPFYAQTTNNDGIRTISLSGYQPGMSAEDQMRLAVILGHEAYRDGIVTSDNYLETRTATLAHTEMAMRMLKDGQNLSFDKDLIIDIAAYSLAGGNNDLFNAYVDKYYDSSADYFRMYLDKDGSVTKVLDDGDLFYVVIVDADGNERRVKLEGVDISISGALAAAAGNGMTKQQMNDLMVASGLTYGEGKGWYAIDERGRYNPINEAAYQTTNVDVTGKTPGIGQRIIETIQSGQNFLSNTAGRFGNFVGNTVGRFGNFASNTVDRFGNFVGGLFDRLFQKKPEVDIQSYTEDNRRENLVFFTSMITIDEDEMWEYSEHNPKNNNYTQCTRFVKESIARVFENGDEILELIFQGKSEDTNTMFYSFQENENLVRLDPFVLGGGDLNKGMGAIQELADNGLLILLIAQNTLLDKNGQRLPGHTAFVGNSSLTLSTKHETAGAYNGMTGRELREQNPSHVVIVHAGTYPGITSIVFATNDYNDLKKCIDLLTNDIHFYAVRRGQ